MVFLIINTHERTIMTYTQTVMMMISRELSPSDNLLNQKYARFKICSSGFTQKQSSENQKETLSK